MKTLLTLLLSASLTLALRAEETKPAAITAADVKDMPTIGIVDLTYADTVVGMEGKIVRLRYTERDNGELKDDGEKLLGRIAESAVHTGRKDGKRSTMALNVELPKDSKEAAAWYHRITSLMPGPSSKTVIVRIVGRVNYEVRVVGLGREMRTGFKGPEFVW